MAERNCYPQLAADLGKLRENVTALQQCCHDSFIEVTPVIKGVSADTEAAFLFEGCGADYIATSRLDQIKKMRAEGIRTKLMMIRIPMLTEVDELVREADAALVSDMTVVRALNEAAEAQNKIFNVIMMMDLGDLREGWWIAEELVKDAAAIEKELDHLHLLGIGTNLTCYGGILPEKRNMMGLASLSADVEKAIGRKLEIISGGSSTSLHMVLDGSMPYRINHLRLGEVLLLGSIEGFAPKFLHQDIFRLRAEVVECREKPSLPVGKQAVDAFGKTPEFEDRGIRKRAIVAVGRIDYGSPDGLTPCMEGIDVLGASSDHTLLDVTDAPREVKVGDILEFTIDYPALVYLTQSPGVYMMYENKPAE